MEIFIAKHEVIIDLHERGYYEDFHMLDNDLFWLQEKQIVKADDFFITEQYSFFGDKLKRNCCMIFGIVVIHSNARGILISYCESDLPGADPIINKKLKDLSFVQKKLNFQEYYLRNKYKNPGKKSTSPLAGKLN